MTTNQFQTLLSCSSCGCEPTLEDHRLVWIVRCQCGAVAVGERAPEPCGDGVSSDEVQDQQAETMANQTDWAYYKQSAILAWNNRTT